MARVALESQAQRSVQGPIENHLQELGTAIIVVLSLLVVGDPGTAFGAALAGSWMLWRHPSLYRRCTIILLSILLALLARSFIQWGWLWREWLSHAGLFMQAVPPAYAIHSFFVEVLLGPAWIEAALLAYAIRRRSVYAQVRSDHRRDKRWWKALKGQKGLILSARREHGPIIPEHPRDQIALGEDGEAAQPFLLDVPADVASHVFLPGANGTGKTTTVTRLADGALANGYAVVIVDAKAGSLGSAARKLATRYGVPFNLVDPDQPKSLGYNPCSGDASAVANKLVGAFTYSANAEIYKNIAMEAVPVVVRGLQASGEPVTLKALYDAFQPRGMVRIAHAIPNDNPLHDRLLDLGGHGSERVAVGGRAGLQFRIGALLEGKFGELFRSDKPLDWDNALANPSVTYIALSALASSEDVELMGRVVAQDLKQTAYSRIRAIDLGKPVIPVLTVFDEFAALNEAEQLVDLLLQARQAMMPTVVSTQYLPELVPLRKACLGAGLLIAHRVESEDANDIAAQFGTRRATEPTQQVDYETGFAEKGSIRWVEKFNVHPNQLRNFKVGQVAIKSVTKQNHALVQIYPDL